MTLSEARRWVDYIAHRGSINPSRRLERGFASLAQLLCIAHGIKNKSGGDIKIDDFMPYERLPDEICTDANQVLELLMGIKNRGN